MSRVMISATPSVQLQPVQWLICLTMSDLVKTPDMAPSRSQATTKCVSGKLNSLAASITGAATSRVTSRLRAIGSVALISMMAPVRRHSSL